MSLSSLKIEWTTVKVAGGEVALRGLSFSDLTKLMVQHAKELNGLIVAVSEKAEDDSAVIGAAVEYLTSNAEVLMAKIIATAANEPEKFETVLQLPGPSQFDMLMAVIRMTFSEPDSLGKFARNISDLLRMAAPGLKFLAESTRTS